MNYPFKKTHIRLLSLALVLVLMAGMFSGCGLFTKEETEPTESTPTAEEVPPGLVEVKPTETTEPPTEETKPLDKNAAVINTDKTPVRQTPSTDANAIGHLDKGTTVTIIREVSIANVGWSLIREGWVTSDSLDKSYVPEETTGSEPGNDTPAETKPAQSTTNKDDDKTTTNTTNNNNNNTNANTNTTGGSAAVVTASELNIRKDANQTSERVGAYRHGDRISILETKNGWGRTNKGWVSLNYVYQDGNRGANPCDGVVIASQLNVRTGPGTNYDRATALNFGARVNVLERVTVNGTTWGYVKGGWIAMEHVYIDGTKSTGAGEGTCTGNAVNIRSGPGTNFAAVGSANSGDPITIYTQIEIGNVIWGYVAKGNVKGWMSMAYANMG